MRAEVWDEVREELHGKILEHLQESYADQKNSDQEICRAIREALLEHVRDHPMDLEDRIRMERELFNSMRKLDILQDLLEDDAVTEIMINGHENIFLEEEGKIRRLKRHFASEEKLADLVQQMVASTNTLVNESRPIADTRWKDGSRIHIVLPPVAVDGIMVSIRRFPKERIGMEKLLELGSISEEISYFLADLVRAGYNIFISGGTGSGKTTFLNALSEFIPGQERVITIEDSAELQMAGISNLVRLEAREASMDGNLEVSIRDLVKTALRMRPDRIIVGECRGSEALEMLQAANTGHDGTLGTGHANSTADMISRLVTMVLMGNVSLPVQAILSQIASGIDIFIHLGRLRDGSRKLLEINEVLGIREGQVELSCLYRYETDAGEEVRGQWKRVKALQRREKLQRAGITAGSDS